MKTQTILEKQNLELARLEVLQAYQIKAEKYIAIGVVVVLLTWLFI